MNKEQLQQALAESEAIRLNQYNEIKSLVEQNEAMQKSHKEAMIQASVELEKFEDEITRLNGMLLTQHHLINKLQPGKSLRDVEAHCWEISNALRLKEQGEVIYQLHARFLNKVKVLKDQADNAAGFYGKIHSRVSEDLEGMADGKTFFDPR